MRFLALRIAVIVPVLVGASMFSFGLVHLAPGDPVNVLLGPYAAEEDRDAMRSALALDQPLPVQYGQWLGRTVTGDLGRSIQLRSPVTDVLFERFKNTLRLGVPSFVLALIVGLVSGALAALRTDGFLDRTLQVLVVFLGTMPIFWLGLILVWVFALELGWFPGGGMGPIGRDATLLETVRYLVLPVVTTAAIPAAIIARSSRSAVREILDEDFVWAAKGRGVRSPALLLRHIIKPVLPMVLHLVGLQFAYLIGGTIVFAEVVFNWPGIGLQTIHAVSSRDFPMIQGRCPAGCGRDGHHQPGRRCDPSLRRPTHESRTRVLGSGMAIATRVRAGLRPADIVGLVLVLVALVFAVAAPLLAPYDPNQGDLAKAFQPPGTTGHFLGTDELGRDLWSRLIWGARPGFASGRPTRSGRDAGRLRSRGRQRVRRDGRGHDHDAGGRHLPGHTTRPDGHRSGGSFRARPSQPGHRHDSRSHSTHSTRLARNRAVAQGA